jgi:anti-anti-sigma regulatory factor
MPSSANPVQLTQPSAESMFTLSRVGDAAMVILSCPAVREWQSSVLSNYLTEVVEQNEGRVVIDVSGIFQFTVAWLHSLISLGDRSQELGGQLVVIGMPRQGRRMMRDAGLAKRLQLAESGDQALAMLKASNVAPWRRAVAKLLSIPVAPTGKSKPKAA